jgi:Leucine-rich repeat (LRR) protein
MRKLTPDPRPSQKFVYSFLIQVILICFFCGSLRAAIPAQERSALIDLYNSTDGANWTNRSGWLGAAGTECIWYGVLCNSTQTSLRWLDLRSNKLKGPIPASIGSFQNLEILYLSSNQLQGSIPPELYTLAGLYELLLDSNQLSGNISTSIGSLSNLHALALNNNRLTGTIPSEIGGLNSLEYIRLFSNQLSGHIPDTIGNLTNLRFLFLESNQLSGSIPMELGNLINLQQLQLDGNQLSGSIPSSLGNLFNLQLLYLHTNQLTGSIPSSFGNLTKLETFLAFSNQLTGNVDPLGNMTALRYFDLSVNQLSGSIPSSLGSLANLQHLELESNELTGGIPASLGNLTQLQMLDLSHNLLTGSIPPELSALSILQYLYLYHNELTGGIPSSLGNLTQLRFLSLAMNHMSGPIPVSLGNLTNLVCLELYANQLSGEIPPELGNLVQLGQLSLGFNQLGGAVPSSFGQLSNLDFLNLASNRLSGSIPIGLKNMVLLYVLDLSHNALHAEDDELVAFLEAKKPGWQNMQTVAPANVAAVAQSSSSIVVSWTPIAYLADAGRYEVYRSASSGGPYTLAGSTATKAESSILIGDLEATTRYYLVVRTVTDAFGDNQNTVVSEYSVESATTTKSVDLTLITIQTDPNGLSLLIDGNSCICPCAFSWVPGSRHIVSASTSQQFGDTRYEFSAWSDGGAAHHAITVPRIVTSVIATFTTEYALTITAIPASGGAVTADPSSSDNFYEKEARVRLKATAGNGYVFSGWGGDLSGTTNPILIAMASPLRVSANFIPGGTGTGCLLSLNSGGAVACRTAGIGDAMRTGYAIVNLLSGTVPYATSVFSLKQNGVTVSEAGVPVSPPTTRARLFIEYRSSVDAVSGRMDSGKININTGIAVANTGSKASDVSYALLNAAGETIATGHGTLAAGKNVACFIDQLKERAAPDFNLPADFQTGVQFGSLEISSSQPLSILGLRGTMNQRNEFIMTTTPAVDLNRQRTNSTVYFPQFADGGGYSSTMILMNTSSTSIGGRLEIIDGHGNPLDAGIVGGMTVSQLMYWITPGGILRIQTSGLGADTRTGWARITPFDGSTAPVGMGIFTYNPEDVLISESGVPSADAVTHGMVYVDLSGGHNTGLALANLSGTSASITVRALQLDGLTPVGNSDGPVLLDPHGHTAHFADEFVKGLPEGFAGILDISSTTPFVALTLRSLVNERNEFLMTTFPVANPDSSAPSPMVFPQVVDGGGYQTEFILISSGSAANTSLIFYDTAGSPVDLIK